MERLSEYERTRLGQICPPNRYQRGEFLYREGDQCNGLTVLLEGQIKLARLGASGQERILFIAGPGDLLGTNFLDKNALHKTDAICMGEVTICPVERSHIEQVARELPDVPLRLAQVLAERVEHLEEQLELSSAPVTIRLGRTFLWLAEKFGQPDSSAWHDLPMELKQDDLAAICGTTRVTVTHTLGELRDRGAVEGTRGRYRVNLGTLERYLQGLEAGV